MRLLVFGSLVLALCGAAPAAAQSQGRILVMPFENVRRDGKIFWLGEAAAVLLADDLNALGASAITRSERQQAFERLQVPPVAALTDATVIRLGQLLGASQVIVGSLHMDDDGALVARARSIVLETGRVQVDVTERGPLPALLETFERIARRFVPSSTRSSEDIARLHPPVIVFENFIKGLLAATPATSIGYLNAALKLQPSFDRARVALWDVYAEQNDHESALETVRRVSDASPFARRATFLAGLSLLSLDRFDEAFTTFKQLTDAQSSAAALNNLGIIQLRRGSTPQTGLATYFFDKAAEADHGDSDYVFNLGYGYWKAHDPQAAIYWLREAVRRNPADADAHFVLGVALASTGNTTESTRELELAGRLSSTYEGADKRAGADAASAVPAGLERIKNEIELPRGLRLEPIAAATEHRDQAELATFYLERGRRMFEQENDRDAAVALQHALYLSPYLAEGHLLLGHIHMRSGRLQEAIDAFKIAIWSAESATAHAALGEAYRQAKDPIAARAEADRALALDPSSAAARALIARLDGR